MRKPARLERAGALTPRDRMWAAMRRFGVDGLFSGAEIAWLSGQHPDTVRTYMVGLDKAGVLEHMFSGRPSTRPLQELQLYRLVRDVGVDAPRVTADGKPVTQGAGHEQMWRAVRVLKGDFDFRELAAAASTEAHPVAPEEARRYLLHLAAGGYVRRVAGRVAAGGTRGATASRYRFVRSRNTGPRAPLVTAKKEVMDANTGEIVYAPEAR